MNACVKVKNLLSRYLDQETSQADTAFVEAHVHTCPLCRKELSALAQVKNVITTRQRKALPEEYVVSRLREQLDAERVMEQQPSWLENIGGLSRKLIPVPVGVIAVSLIFFMLISGQQVKSLEDSLLNADSTTTEMALDVILGE